MWKPLALAASIAILSSPALAANKQCNNRDKVLGMLATKYKEVPVALGVTNNGGLIEVLSAGDGTTWTIIITTPQGMSCLVAAGEGWRKVERLVSTDPEA